MENWIFTAREDVNIVALNRIEIIQRSHQTKADVAVMTLSLNFTSLREKKETLDHNDEWLS